MTDAHTRPRPGGVAALAGRLVSRIGYGAMQLRRALPVGIVCVQNAYSLVDRGSEPVLELCREHDIAWVPYFPLGSGWPDAPKVTELPDVVSTAEKLAMTPSQVGLAWLLAHDEHTLVIPGTRSVAHLEENLAAGDAHVTDPL